MIFISVSAKIIDTNKLFIRDRNNSDKKIKIRITDEQYKNLIFRNDEIYVYKIAVFGRGAFCEYKREKNYYYKVKTNETIFLLTKYLEENHIKSYEIFDYWRLHRRENNYYIEIRLYTVSIELIKQYLYNLENWISQNGILENRKRFNIPIPKLKKQTEDLVKIELSEKTIEKLELEDDNTAGDICNNWDTEWPEFEGSDAIATIDLIVSSFALLIAVLGLLGIATPEQREYRLVKSRIKQAKKIIYERFKVRGYLEDPPVTRHFSNDEFPDIYLFLEYNKRHKLIANYYAKFTADRGEEPEIERQKAR